MVKRKTIIFLVIFLILAIVFLSFVFLKKDNKNNFALEKNLVRTNAVPKVIDKTDGLEFAQKKEFTAPEIINSVYITSWSASKKSHIDYILNLAKSTEINAVVVDVKDYSGHIGYDISSEIDKYGAKQKRISDIDKLVEEFHKSGIYTIARITVFQDPILAKARSDLAIHDKNKLIFATSDFSFLTLWFDKDGLAWIDPSAKESWDYNISIAKDAIKRGFDEVNFDYVRFPSDGSLENMIFPFFDGKTEKSLIIRDFFQYLSRELAGAKISIDLFGLTTVSNDDLGVGQKIEDAFLNFDYVCPMVYPSHYADGFQGYDNPAEYPYEVIKYSMDSAISRLKTFNEKKEQGRITKLRPWIQDFNLGATYDFLAVQMEIKAIKDALKDDFYGYMAWNSKNFYTAEAFLSQP